MLMLDFNLSAANAFKRGFAKGFAAPVLLYGSFDASAAVPHVDPVAPTRLQGKKTSVWQAVGADFATAIATYEKQAAIAATR
jgi:hypothetical protein